MNLYIGLRSGSGVRNISDYALGGRNFSTAALVATIVATWSSGSGFYITLTKVYSDGIYFVVAYTLWVLQLIITAYIFVPRMGEFLGKLSLPEAFGELYGKRIEMIIAVAGVFSAIGIIAVQFKIFASIFNYFLHIPSSYAVIVAGLIVTVYSAFGGIRAVTFTDIFQAIVFGVAVPMIGVVIWYKLNDDVVFTVSNALKESKFNLVDAFSLGNPKLWQMLPLLIYFMIPSMEPAFVQRIMMGKNLKQVQKAFVISASILLFIKLFTAWIPFLLFQANPNIEVSHLIPYIIDNYSNVLIKGVILIGISALAMSTADSHMNVASVLFAHDLCKPMFKIDKYELLISRFFSVAIGIFAIVIALYSQDILTIILQVQSIYMPVVTMPFILTIMGFRSSEKSLVIGMIAGLISSILWKIFVKDVDGIVFSMLVNAIFFITSHYVLKQPGGWLGPKDNKFIDQENERKKLKKRKFSRLFKNFSLLKFLKSHAPKDELTYAGFGIYCIIFTLMMMYQTDIEIASDNSNILLYFYQVMIVTGTMLGSFPFWPKTIKYEIAAQIWWPLALFYMLGYFSAFFLMQSGYASIQFAVFSVNAMVMLILVGWRLGALNIILGYVLASYTYQYIIQDSLHSIREFYSDQSLMIYVLFLLGAAILIFLKPREEQESLKEELVNHLASQLRYNKEEISELMATKNEFLRNIEHETKTPITGIVSMGQVFAENYHKLSEKDRISAVKEIANSSSRLDSWASNLVDLSRISKRNLCLKIQEISLGELLEERLEICQRLYYTIRENR